VPHVVPLGVPVKHEFHRLLVYRVIRQMHHHII
jgi:hypothetical protein